ncbi:MAG: hypothetical protein AB1635_08930, partial [Acidobacteriota bacterium]
MTVLDWRNLPTARVAPLYEAEEARWRRDLSWDARSTWRIVEDARRAGELPGYALVGASGAVEGWTFFLVHGDTLQIGALTAREARGVRRLLDEVMQAPEASLAQRVS